MLKSKLNVLIFGEPTLECVIKLLSVVTCFDDAERSADVSQSVTLLLLKPRPSLSVCNHVTKFISFILLDRVDSIKSRIRMLASQLHRPLNSPAIRVYALK